MRKHTTTIIQPNKKLSHDIEYVEYDDRIEFSHYTLHKATGDIINNDTGYTFAGYRNPKNHSGIGNGYCQVSLSFNGVTVTKPIHKLIALFKFGKMANYADASHINHIRYDNSWDNIEIDTTTQRGKHAK